MTDRRNALGLLRKATADPTVDFRKGQWEAIDALVNRRERLLVVERTGWGKSSVYFIATRVLRDSGHGPTLIVSPLLALMRNQIAAAVRLGIRAETINSTNPEDWPRLHRAVGEDKVDALLISPERLANDEFADNVLSAIAGRLGLLVVDEAHCISDWGHDFRPDYRRLVNVLQRMPRNVPIIGTTATANDRVIRDVRAQLGDIGIQRGSLRRQTLSLGTMRLPSRAERLAWLAEHVDSLPGTGIIYTLTRRDANLVAEWLEDHGIPVRAYHGDVTGAGFENSAAYRRHLEDQLLGNRIKALVATTALGMGYDKPDLGFVVHYQAPGSLIAYYQQVGRAGRGIGHAVGLLMSGAEDRKIHQHFRKSAFPRERWVVATLNALEESDGLTVHEIEKAANLTQDQIKRVLKFLSAELPAPVIRTGAEWRRTPVPYRMDREKIRRLTEQREAEWREVQEYIDEEGCLMRFLTRALDDPDFEPCGRCASCLARPVVELSFTRETAVSAVRFLHRPELPLQCNTQVPANAFREYAFQGNLPAWLHAETGRVLSRWGDAGWGQSVADDKRAGRFRDGLVEAAAEMVNDRWRPAPPPQWVTCVPSRNHPNLVPGYAERLAGALGLPFASVVTKVRDNDPQKVQQNEYHQARNLDGVFAIDGPLPEGSVLLVDDVVDSGWTLTVVAALLRRNGSGRVWPLALATSNTGA